jgi:tetratricopeptide (TPR) repeat protein
MSGQQPQLESAATAPDSGQATQPGRGPSIDQRRARRVNLSLLGIVFLIAATATLLRSPGEVARWYLAAAKEEYSKGNAAAAVELIETAISKNPGDAELYRQLAVVQYAEKEYEPCLKNLTVVIEKQPHEPYGYDARGAVFRKLKRYGEAVRDADAVLRIAEQGGRVSYSGALNDAAYCRALAGEDLQRALRDVEIAVTEIRSAIRSVASGLRDDALVRGHLQALNLSLAATLDTRGYLHYRLAEAAESRDDAEVARQHVEAAREDLDEAVDLHVRNVDEIRKQLLTSDPLARGFWSARLRGAVKGLGEMYYHRGLTLDVSGEDRRAVRDFERARDCGFPVDEGH